jgi:hypothetical protein
VYQHFLFKSSISVWGICLICLNRLRPCVKEYFDRQIFEEEKYIGQHLYSETFYLNLSNRHISSSNYKLHLYLITIFVLNTRSKKYAMEPSSSSGESIRYIETYATAANHPMPAILKARRVVLLCGLFGVYRSHDRSTPFIAEMNQSKIIW